ncbi:porin [Sodalis-like secondary symbiont of Drepanosiphum platanoidis]|uniref:porin n=1 Tax=Sodalis-like secondary symbiont of Drepanosiphum platanoidis TaxID=2994493 RepID=UPI0034644350
MKLRYLTIFLSVLAMATSNVNATEIYNKDNSKIDLFGQLTGLHYLSHDKDLSGDQSNISYGIYAETPLNDKLNAFGVWEYKAMLHSSQNRITQDHKTVLGYAGVNIGEHAKFDFGKNFGIMHDIGSWTSQSQEFGRHVSCIDNFFSSRSANIATYRNDNFFGLVDNLNVAIQYQGKNNNLYKNPNKKVIREFGGEGYGFSMIYDFKNGIYAGAAYTSVNANNNQQFLQIEEKHTKDSEAYSLGIKYEIDNTYFAILYGETRNITPFGKNDNNPVSLNNLYGLINKAKNIEFLAQYEFESGLRPSIGYVHSQWKDKSSGERQKLKEHLEIGTSYVFNKNITTFINYQINLLKDNYFLRASSISTDNIVALGMSYVF